MENVANTQAQASLSGYLPNGQRAFFTIPLGNLAPAAAYDFVLNFSQTLLSKGLLLTEPGLEAGELKETAGWVARGTQTNADGETPVIFLYADNQKMHHKLVRCYLNTPDDISAFETASGLRLLDLPLWEAKGEPERGAAKEDKYVIRCPHPFAFVYKKNPRYNPEEKDIKLRKPQHLFIRFDIQMPAQSPASVPVAALQAATVKPTITPPSVATDPLPATNSGNPATTFEDIPSVFKQPAVNPVLLTWSDEAIATKYPAWPIVKDKVIAQAMGNFHDVLEILKIYGDPHNGYEMRKSLEKMKESGELRYSTHTLSQGVVIVLNHRETKTPGNVVKIATEELKRETIERALEQTG